jgi:hypothetical protein
MEIDMLTLKGSHFRRYLTLSGSEPLRYAQSVGVASLTHGYSITSLQDVYDFGLRRESWFWQDT